MSLLRNIFTKSLSNSAKAYKRLDEGKEITFKPQSDRYTYENQQDTDYDKDWKPETKEERKTLSPKGYHRIGERSQVKEDLGIDDENKDFYHEKQISIPSTAIDSFQYDPDTEGLTVKFTSSSKEYFYPGVPLELIEAWMKAPSKGEFFMRYIHDQYSLNKSHRPAGSSPTYGDLTSRQVSRFMKKYKKDYQKNNKGKWTGGMVNV